MGHIRIYDFETTGLEPPEAKVIEVGFCDVVGDERGWNIGKSGSWLCGAEAIPPEVRAVHHIAANDIAGLAAYDAGAMWAQARADGVEAAAAHNLDFEAKFWGACPVPVLCTYKSALRAWPAAPSHSNGALRYWLEDQGRIAPVHDKTMPPHRAGPDAYVTAWLLLALLRAHTASEMVAWTKEPRLMPIINFGKHRGTKWPDAPRDYLEWLLRSDMDADTKWNAQRELNRRKTGVAA